MSLSLMVYIYIPGEVLLLVDQRPIERLHREQVHDIIAASLR
jgi:hypothetical protein